MNAEEARVEQAASETPKSEPCESAKGSPGALAELSSSSKRVLEPIERISEVLFGLIMVLTFTCTFSVAESRCCWPPWDATWPGGSLTP